MSFFSKIPQGFSSASTSPLPPSSKNEILDKEIVYTEVREDLSRLETFPISEKTFLLLHGDSFLGDSLYQGGNLYTNLLYFKQVVEHWKTQSSELSPWLSLQEIEQLLADCDAMLLTLQFQGRDKTDAEGFYNFIIDQLESRNRCVFPIFIIGNDGDAGHVLMCILRREKGKLLADLLDKGEGIDFQPAVEITDTKKKSSYRFPTLQLHADLLTDREKGLTFFRRLFAFNTPQKKRNFPYATKDIYAHFLTVGCVGQERPNIEDGVTPQRSGTCSMQALLLLSRFNSYNIGKAKNLTDQRKRVKFVLRFQSLLDAYHHLPFDDAGFRKQMSMVLHGFSASLEKHYPQIISDQELLLARTLAELVEEKIQAAESSTSLQALSLQQVLPDTFDPITLKQKEDSLSAGIVPKSIPAFNWEGLQDSETIHITVQNLLAFVEDLPKPMAAPYISHLFYHLPVPTGEEEEFWAQVPLENISALVSSFRELVIQGLKSNQNNGSSTIRATQAWMITFGAYTIVHRLALRLPELQLESFGFKINCDFGPSFFFSLGHEREHYLKIKKYIEKFREGEKGVIDYSFVDEKRGEGVLKNFAEAVDKVERGISGFDSYTGLLRYIRLFLTQEPLSESGTAYRYAITWEKYLGQEFYSLQHLAVLTQLFSDRFSPFSIRAHKTIMAEDWSVLWELGRTSSSFQVTKFTFLHPEIDSYSSFELEREKHKDYDHENELLTEKPWGRYDFYKEWGTENARVQSLYRLYLVSAPSVRAAALLDWLYGNKALLDFHLAQQEIKRLLFGFTNLKIVAEEKSQLIAAFRLFFDRRVELLLNKPIKDKNSLFWLQIAYEFETQMILLAEQKEEAERRIKFMHEVVNQLLDGRTLAQEVQAVLPLLKIYFFSHVKNPDPKVMTEAASAFIFNRLMESEPVSYLYWKASAFMQLHMTKLEQAWSEDPSLVQSGLERVGRYLNLSGRWEGGFPCYENGSFSIDLSIPDLRYNGESFNRQKDFSYWVKDNFFDLPVNLKVIATRDRQLFIFDQQQIDFSNGWLKSSWVVNGKKSTFTTSYSSQSKIPFRALSHYGTLWQSEDNSSEFILINRQRRPTLLVRQEGEYCRIMKLDEEGYETEETVANLTNEHLPWLSQLLDSPSNDCIVWQRERQICRFEIPNFELLFEAKGDYFVHSTTGLIVLEDQKQPFPEGKLPLIGLENKNGEKHFILLHEYYYHFKNYDYFLFTLNKVNGDLECKSPEGYIALIAQLVKHGDYLSALHYLKKLDFPERYRGSNLFQLSRLIEDAHDPIASSFVLHVAFHLIENENLMTRVFFEDKSSDNHFKSQARSIQKNLVFILSIMSSSDQHRIPEALSLTLEMRIALADYLIKTIEEKVLHEAIRREHQLLVEGRPITVQIVPSPPFYTLECGFNEWDELKQVVRSKEELDLGGWAHCKWGFGGIDLEGVRENLKDNFFAYYNFFLQKPPAYLRDMLLLAIASNLPPESYGGLKLICCVAHFPDEFSRFSASQEGYARYSSSENNRAAFFNTVVEKAIRILNQKGSLKFTIPESGTELLSRLLICDVPTPIIETKIALPPVLLSQSARGYSFPLEEIASEFYHPQPQLPFTDTCFFEKTHPLNTPLAEQMYAQLQIAHRENCSREVVFYEQIKQAEALKEVLIAQRTKDRAEADRLKQRIEHLANRGFDDNESTFTMTDLIKASKEKLRLIGMKRERLTLSNHLYRALLTNDASLLQHHNPALTEEEIQDIYSQMLQYMLIASRIDQTQEALVCLAKIGKAEIFEEKALLHQQLAAILYKERIYDPGQYPLFLAYEYATGKLLRKEQVELLTWIFKEKNVKRRAELLIEFEAGGGKTKVVSVLLSLHAIREGYLPIFFSLPALYDVTKEDLRDTFSLLHMSLKVLEISLNTPLSQRHLSLILTNLLKWQKEGNILSTLPEAFYALHLAFKTACEDENSERIESLMRILSFLETNGYFIIDEAHRNASPTETAIIAKGNPRYLPEEERELFVICYRALTNPDETLTLEDGRAVHTLLNLTDNMQALTSEADLKEIFKALAHYLVQHPLLNISEEWREPLATYLHDKTALCPVTLDDAPLVFLARGLLTEILEPVFRMVHGFDYGSSIREEDEVESPRFQRMPTTAQYEPDISAALCCQGLYQRGLSAKQIKTLLQALYGECKELLSEGYDEEEIPQVVIFKKWQEACGHHAPFLLPDFPLFKEEDFITLADLIGRHPQVVERYLSYHLLTQVKILSERYRSTAADLLGGGAFGLAFTATLGRVEEYPQGDRSVGFRPANHFQAAVVARATSSTNSSFIYYDMKKRQQRVARDPFDELWQSCRGDREMFQQFLTFIDGGGMNRDFTTEETAEAFLDLVDEQELDYDGVACIKESEGLNVENELTFIHRDEQGIRTKHHLKGSDLLASLKRIGFKKPERLKIFKIYGSGQCTGTDLYIESNAKILITFGEVTYIYFLIQAFMRARDAIRPVKEKEDQRWMQQFFWMGPRSLKQEIDASQGLFFWGLEKEAELSAEKIIASALHDITKVFSGWLWEEMKRAGSAREIVRLYRRHKAIFQETKIRDLENMYAHPDKDCETRSELEAFRDQLLRLANLSSSWLEGKKSDTINRVIENAVQAVPTIRKKGGAKETLVSQSKASEQNKEDELHKAKVEQKNIYANSSSRNLAYPRREVEILFKEGLFFNPNRNKRLKSARRVFKTTLLPPNLFFTRDVLFTYSGKSHHIKPVVFCLLVLVQREKSEERYVFGCTNQDAEDLSEILKKSELPEGVQMALMTVRGAVDSQGKNKGRIDPEWYAENENWLSEMLTQLAFCSGVVTSYDNLQKQIEKWQKEPDGVLQIHDLWNTVQEKQLFTSSVYGKLITSLLPKKRIAQVEEEPAPPAEPSQERMIFREAEATLDDRYIKFEAKPVKKCSGAVCAIAGIIVTLLAGGGVALFIFMPLGPSVLVDPLTIPSILCVGAGACGILLIAIGSVLHGVAKCRRRGLD